MNYNYDVLVALLAKGAALTRRYSDVAWSSRKVRTTFIEFFQRQDHLFVPSSSVIPKKNDGSYFVNAGMNQVAQPYFKKNCVCVIIYIKKKP